VSGTGPLLDQHLAVTIFVPTQEGPQAVALPDGAVAFPDGPGVSAHCFAWTPGSAGRDVVRVAVAPTIDQFTGDDTATRSLTIGTSCELHLSRSSVSPRPGLPTSVQVLGVGGGQLDTVLALSVGAPPSSTVPPGLMATFDPPSPLGIPFTTTLSVGVDE